MTPIEIVAGILMIISCVVLIVIVLSQNSKGQGLSSVITGTEMMSGETRTHSKEARQVRITKIFGVVFFVLAILVNVLNGIFNAAG